MEIVTAATDAAMALTERKRAQSRRSTARYRGTANGQEKIVAYEAKRTTRVQRMMYRRARRLSIEYRAQDLKDKAHSVARRKGKHGERCTVTTAAVLAKLRPLVCEISGIRLELTQRPAFSRNPFSPSLDRIDRRGFHTDDNTRITSTLANTAMSEWGVEYLEETAFHILCMRVPSHLRDALMAWRNYQTTFGVSGVESTAAIGSLGDVRQRVTK